MGFTQSQMDQLGVDISRLHTCQVTGDAELLFVTLCRITAALFEHAEELRGILRQIEWTVPIQSPTAALFEHAEELRGILRQIEWTVPIQSPSSDDIVGYGCPICGGEEPDHDASCSIKMALYDPPEESPRT
jgi:hypothetical protein